jgi:uncharacterized protein YifN (PemK superfamily)
MAFFTDKFMSNRREQLFRSLVRFQYQINGGTWYDGEINSKEIIKDEVVVLVNAPSSGQADTITGARVYDDKGNLAGTQTVSLKRSSLNTGLIRFAFPLTEG